MGQRRSEGGGRGAVGRRHQRLNSVPSICTGRILSHCILDGMINCAPVGEAITLKMGDLKYDTGAFLMFSLFCAPFLSTPFSQ